MKRDALRRSDSGYIPVDFVQRGGEEKEEEESGVVSRTSRLSLYRAKQECLISIYIAYIIKEEQWVALVLSVLKVV